MPITAEEEPEDIDDDAPARVRTLRLGSAYRFSPLL